MFKLLIVDDEPLTREYVRLNLEMLHDQWTFGGEAGDGQEALDLLAGGETFDLILTDIKMPAMNGLELARKVSERYPGIRMVILSGYDEFALAREAIRYGVEEYLLKPVVKEELAAVLDRMAARAEADRQDRLAYQTLVKLSEETRGQVARNFLRALVSDNDVEIKALYPIVFRLKISLIEAEAAVILTVLDEAELVRQGLQSSETALYRYILHQTAAELTDAMGGALVFFDGQQRTTVLVTGEDASDVQNRCRMFYENLEKAIVDMTGLRLRGATGPSVIDVMQVNASYRAAADELPNDPVPGNEDLDNAHAVGDEHGIVAQAKNYIYDHFAEPVSLALLAEKTGVTPGYLSSLFHQEAQESYIKFLTRVRMEHAAMLLRARPPEKVYDVSEKVGYVSVKHFSYVFKQHFGMPPGEYQERDLSR